MRDGKLEAVWVERYGCHLTASAAINDTVLSVSFTADLSEDGGQLQHVETGDILDFTTIDPDAETVTLTSPLAAAIDEGDTLRVYPLSDDLFASVRLDDAADDEEPIEARVSQALRPVIPEGVREDERESVRVEGVGTEWVVQDVVATAPLIDGAFLDPTTVPNARDGLAPDASPLPELIGGIGALFVKVDGVENNDPVVYEYHISTTTGFTADATTLATESNGTLVSLRSLPDGTPLAVGTTYYVVVIAKDLDGSAAPSLEVSGQLGQVNSPDLATNSVITDHLTANLINAEHLGVIELEAARIFSPAQTGWRVEIGDAAKPIQYWNGTDAGFFLDHDPVTNKANVAVSGRVTFGNSLLENDWAEFAAQGPGFQIPNQRQKVLQSTAGAGTSVNASWPNATVKGNLLLAAVLADGEVSTPTISAPSGWTQAATVTGSTMRLSLFYINNAAVRSGAETFTLSSSSWRCMILFEASEIAMVSPLDRTATASGTGATVSSGTTLTTTQADEGWFAFGAVNFHDDTGIVGDPTNSFDDLGDCVGYLPGFGWQARLDMAARNVTATAAASTTWALGEARSWVGIIATFKAAENEGDPNPPATTACRLYAKQRDSGYVELHTIDETGRQTRPGSGWNLLDQGLVPAAGLNFTNIPDWYQDLKVLIRGFTTGDSGTTYRLLQVRFNGDATSNYVHFGQRWRSDGTTAVSESDSDTQMYLSAVGRSTSATELTVYGYSRPTGITVCEARGGFHSGTRKGVVASFGRWNTTDAVTSMSVALAVDFGVGSLYELYGVGTKVT